MTVHARVLRRLSERQAVEMVLAPFLHAMHYLHTRGIMHRDIKPENVGRALPNTHAHTRTHARTHTNVGRALPRFLDLTHSTLEALLGSHPTHQAHAPPAYAWHIAHRSASQTQLRCCMDKRIRAQPLSGCSSNSWDHYMRCAWHM